MRKWGAKGNEEGEADEQQLDFTSAGGGSEGESTPGERKHLGKSGIDQEDAVRRSTHVHSLPQPPAIPLLAPRPRVAFVREALRWHSSVCWRLGICFQRREF